MRHIEKSRLKSRRARSDQGSRRMPQQSISLPRHNRKLPYTRQIRSIIRVLYARRTCKHQLIIRESGCRSQHFRQIIRDLKGIEIGTLHIGATYSLSPLLISAMNLFTKAYPGIKVLVSFATSGELIDRLKDNSLDFILSFDAEEWPAELERQLLFASRLCVIVHHTHPLSGLTSITWKRLEQIPLVLPEKGFATRKKLDNICRKHHLNLTVGIEMNDVHTIIHTLSGGHWATILTEAAVRGESGLVRIPILCTDQTASKAFLFWPQGIYRKKSALTFAECLQQIAKGETKKTSS